MLNIDWFNLRPIMDPIFEPIFDFSENMAGFPYGFSKPHTYWDEMLHREHFGTSGILRDIFGDTSPFSTDSFLDNLPRPYWMTPGYISPAHPRRDYIPFPGDLFSGNFLRPSWAVPGYVTPAHPRRDYILDQESGPSSSSYSFSSSSYSSDSNGQRCESIKASVRQPDGVIINKEIMRKDGREVTTTTTIHPDGRQESKTETTEGALTDVPSVFVPSTEGIFKESEILPNFRRWFGL
ncbi:hypothetical protein TcWFU_007092 [Taenia crassiceps]|uniref:Uncharacterized protein n=1 Tax=Taenia crassiceps TaxID=6207 RepID=A0ABR4QID9_9CEST